MTQEAIISSTTPASAHQPGASSGYAYFKGRFMPVEEANINIMTHAFLYGTAVFEGIRAYTSQTQPGQIFIFRLAEHFERLKRSARVLNMNLPGATEELIEVTRQLVRSSGYQCDIYIRALSFKSARRIGVQLDGPEEFALFVLPMGEKYQRIAEGIHVGVSSWRRVEDNAIPSRAKINGSYVNLALSATEVRANGFDEALLLNEDGHLSEGAGMNVFLIRNGTLITPDVNANILEGVTRDSIQRMAKAELGIDTLNRSVDRTELYSADELFLCGTAAEIAPVVSVDRRSVGTGQVGPITRQLAQIYRRVTRGEIPAYRDWLVPAY